MNSIKELDCNCNNCKHMVRDIPRREKSVEDHRKWSFNHFNAIRSSFLIKAYKAEWVNNIKRALNLRKEAKKMKWQFDKTEAAIHYGKCTKFNKDVQFIPNVCQLDTQECYEIRK